MIYLVGSVHPRPILHRLACWIRQSRVHCVDNGHGKKEENILFSDTLNTFCLWIYGVGHRVKDHSDIEKSLCCHSVSREETRCCNMGYSFQLTARVHLYAPSHRQDSTKPWPLLNQSWSTNRNEKISTSPP